MTRALVLASSLFLLTSIGRDSQAQQEPKPLQGSVERLERNLQRMEDYLQTVQRGEARKDEESQRGIKDLREEVRRLRESLQAKEVELASQRDQGKRAAQEADSRLAKAHTELEVMKQATERERVRSQELAASVEQLRRQIAATEHNTDETARSRDRTHQELLARIERERSDAAATARTLHEEIDGLRTANGRLQRELDAARQGRGPPTDGGPTGTVQVIVDDGEVQIHFHAPVPWLQLEPGVRDGRPPTHEPPRAPPTPPPPRQRIDDVRRRIMA